MSWFRSEEMEFVQLIFQEDVTHDCVDLLGKLGAVQFVDLNPDLTPFQRRYVHYIRRCDEMERRLRYFEEEMSNYSISPDSPGEVEGFLEWYAQRQRDRNTNLLDDLETMLERREKELMQLNSFNEQLTRSFNQKIELKHVMEKARQFFLHDAPIVAQEVDDMEGATLLSADVEAGEERSVKFSYLTGVVAEEDRLALDRMIFRATRGNCYTRFAEIEEPITDPVTKRPVRKCVFILFFQARSIERKLKRICEAFNAHRYDVPDLENAVHVGEALRQADADIRESEHVLRQNRDTTVAVLSEIGQYLSRWQWAVMKEKSIYHTMNLFRPGGGGLLHARGWAISAAVDEVRTCVKQAHSQHGTSLPSFMTHVEQPWPTPPTHFKLNKFTKVFQGTVDTYGVPRYQEANPALFTTITFPFLFGIMYGDLGHATMLTSVALFFVLYEKKLKKMKLNEMISMCFTGRYMLLLMGCCAMYCGLLYNDVFSLTLNLFGSKWNVNDVVNGTYQHFGPVNSGVYPFGMDPTWHVAENQLLFHNSLKMKISVIFGVSQMFFGLLLRTSNALFTKNKLDLFLECIPMMAFMISFFGYMLFCIFFKWTVDWNVRMAMHENPPSLIITLMDMVLKSSALEDRLYDSSLQLSVQKIFVLIFVLTPLIMLFPKPFILNSRLKKEAALKDKLPVQEVEKGMMEMQMPVVDPHGDDEAHSFGELFIHQLIEVIEFVLGTVSHTASYLRLWALSLAHAQLAEVFWGKIMVTAINTNNPVFIVVGFSIFAAITVGVLCLMDVLECYLHALRLHWVEFQSKFYRADGYKFEPFCFKALLSQED